jgi:hypothetical protein
MSSIVSPPTHANSFVIGPAVINTHNLRLSSANKMDFILLSSGEVVDVEVVDVPVGSGEVVDVVGSGVVLDVVSSGVVVDDVGSGVIGGNGGEGPAEMPGAG